MTLHHATLTAARPTRRTVARASAWTVPVIAVAATTPAHAASCAAVRATSANITAYDRVSALEWNATFDVDRGGPLPGNVMTARATYDSGMSVRNDGPNGTHDNFTIGGSVGGLGTAGLVMAQRPTLDTPAAPLTAFGHYAFSFSKPVSKLSFTLTDIDSATGDFWDSVWLTPGFTVSNKAAGLQGAGTAADPFRQTSGNTPVDNTNGGAGNVTLTYAGTLTAFTINYSNAATSFARGVDQDQVVTITNFAFEFQPC